METIHHAYDCKFRYHYDFSCKRWYQTIDVVSIAAKTMALDHGDSCYVRQKGHLKKKKQQQQNLRQDQTPLNQDSSPSKS
jgi:hypothetical protein